MSKRAKNASIASHAALDFGGKEEKRQKNEYKKQTMFVYILSRSRFMFFNIKNIFALILLYNQQRVKGNEGYMGVDARWGKFKNVKSLKNIYAKSEIQKKSYDRTYHNLKII